MNEALIRTVDLTRFYGRKLGCRDVDLSVCAGEIFGLLGPNGAGKSTVMKLLTGLIRPSSGRASIMGYPVGSPASRRYVGFLPEGFRYHKWLTGGEILALHAALQGLPRRDAERRIAAKLELVGLSQARRQRFGAYSKGMQQRLGLAAALVAEPRLLFLDEPSAALDPMGRREVRNLLLELRRAGATVLLNSHLLGEVEMVCDRVAFMKEGRIAAHGSLADFLSESSLLEIEIRPRPSERAAARRETAEKLRAFGEPQVDGDRITLTMRDPARVPDVARVIVDAGVDLLRLAPRRRSLEDLFVSLMGRPRIEEREDRA
jgi:ABC-2 type transport system ATP-binding protein